MDKGWIGTWSPGIGDPTVGGWVTVFLYAWAAWMVFRVLQLERLQRFVLSTNEKTVWHAMLVGLVGLGINKQLDLQSAMTEIARMLAIEQGWYDNRRQYQEAFIVAVPIAGMTALAAMVLVIWKAPAATLWACVGAAGLLIFVAIRATSFHGVDQMLGWRLAGLPLNWVLEMGSLLVIGWNARRRGGVQT